MSTQMPLQRTRPPAKIIYIHHIYMEAPQYDCVDATSRFLTVCKISYIYHIYTTVTQYECVDVTSRYLTV